MKFCSQCGCSVHRKIPSGDNRERFVCGDCQTIHYQNPRIITGCLPVIGEKVLLCKRAINPRKDYWTLPAGFMENGETTEAGAIRETWEEARAKVEVEQLYTLFNLPHISQVYLFYRARLPTPDYSAGPESTDVQLFDEHEIPWDELAFPVIRETLQYFYADRTKGDYQFRAEEILIHRQRQTTSRLR